MYKQMAQEIAERVNEDIQTCRIEVTSTAAKAVLYRSVNAKRPRLQELSKLIFKLHHQVLLSVHSLNLRLKLWGNGSIAGVILLALIFLSCITEVKIGLKTKLKVA